MVSICLTRRVGALARLHGRETKYFSRNRSTKTKVCPKAMPIQATTFHDFSGKTLGGGTRENPTEGAEISYSKFRGKVVLINNVATM